MWTKNKVSIGTVRAVAKNLAMLNRDTNTFSNPLNSSVIIVLAHVCNTILLLVVAKQIAGYRVVIALFQLALGCTWGDAICDDLL